MAKDFKETSPEFGVGQALTGSGLAITGYKLHPIWGSPALHVAMSRGWTTCRREPS